jgi:hypothetical protein
MVTVLGFGGVAGAVYVAEPAVTFPPADCVVTTVSVPHAAALQPGPDNNQLRTLLGFEPGTGVSVATIVAVPLDGTLAGAEICKLKLLVIVIAAEPFFDESATL